MSQEIIVIANEQAKIRAVTRIMEIDADGTKRVTIGAAGSKSSRQRGLQWRWYSDIASAGIGGAHEDTKDGVHLVSKYRWAIPILIRDDPFFCDLYTAWKEMHGSDEERMMWFVDTQVSTESFRLDQAAEYMNDIAKHYGPLCSLTDPADYGFKL